MRHFFTLCTLCFSFIFYRCQEKHYPEATAMATTDSLAANSKTTEADSNQYLYDFLRMVINDQKLQYSYGLSLNVEPTLSHGDDYAYLINFIKQLLLRM